MRVLGLITVKTIQQFEALSIQNFIFGAIAGVVFLTLAALIAYVIKFEGGDNPGDPRKRRLWFRVLLVVSFVIVFLYNMFFIAPTVAPNLRSKFMTTNVISSLIDVVTYLVIGFILSKSYSTGKLGNWFPSKKNN